MMRRCSVMRMPLAAHRASIFLFSELRLSGVATITPLRPSYHISGKIAAQHQRGGGFAPGHLIIVGTARYFVKAGAVIEPHGGLIVFIDFQEYGARAKGRQPPQM